MKGIELSERFYAEFGEPMIRREFPSVERYIAVGLTGSGSECFGFDDEISRDHDFEAGFCIFLPDEDIVDRRTAFELERAYSRLPKEYMGYRRSIISAVGGNRHGVIRMSDFFTQKTGRADGDLSLDAWMSVPEQSLAEATNGKVFFDGLGRFTEIRERLSYLPDDVRLKKLAGNLLIMGQSGQYNYGRCLSRGETGAAQLAVSEFVRSAMNCIFLLNKKYIPYYKWSFCALRGLDLLSCLGESLEYLISSGNTPNESKTKSELIEKISSDIIKEIREQALTSFYGDQLEGHAYSVNDRIANGQVRNLHILYAI